MVCKVEKKIYGTNATLKNINKKKGKHFISKFLVIQLFVKT